MIVYDCKSQYPTMISNDNNVDTVVEAFVVQSVHQSRQHVVYVFQLVADFFTFWTAPMPCMIRLVKVQGDEIRLFLFR